MNDALQEEFRELTTDEGAVKFIAQHTSLSEDRVKRIYTLGKPWPLGGGEGWDFGRQAQEADVDIFTFIKAINPLIDMEVQEKEAKVSAFEAAIERGENPALPPEFEDPERDEHLEKVATLTGEDIEIVMEVFGGVLARLQRLNELLEMQIERQSP